MNVDEEHLVPVGGDTHPRRDREVQPSPARPRRVRVVHLGAVYFVTTITADRKPILFRRGIPRLLLADLWIALRLKETECYALALLPEHVHLILRPLGKSSLSQFMHSWKRNTSRNANRLFEGIGFRWQESFREHALRDERDLINHYRYVLGNPSKHGGGGFAKCYPEGLLAQGTKGPLGQGQDLYPGLREVGIGATDKEIDRLVYDLYGLTEEEIAAAEGSP